MRILRYRQIVRHVTPTYREITDEYTVLNDSGKDTKFLPFHAYSYRANLHVYDSDGTELVLYPNATVRAYLTRLDEKWSQDLLKSINDRSKYVQIVQLPTDKALKNGDARVFRFTYVDHDEPIRISILHSLFNLPTFQEKKVIPTSQNYSTHVTILAPVDFGLVCSRHNARELLLDGKERVLSDEDHYHETVGSAVADFALPTGNNLIRFNCNYYVYPEKSEAILLRGFFWSFTVLSVFFSLILIGIFDGTFIQPFVAAVKANYQLIGAILFGVSIGFLGIVTNPLTHRTKFAILIPLWFLAFSMLLYLTFK